ncbi:MAG: BatD family protein [Spirochaetales bacterium]|nr:BatD family protein [Spirochaetales bacterium]MCF7938145.1 BatD family protein [Spirochaetales bacterium]
MRRFSKTKNDFLFSVSLLCGALLLFAAAFPAAASEDPTVVVDPETVRKGEQFEVSIRADFPDPAKVNVIEPPLSSALTLLRGPYIQPITERRRETTRQIVSINYTFRAERSGRIAIGSFIVRLDGKSFRTGAVEVRVLPPPEEKRRFDFSLSWRVPDRPLYEGETVAVALEAEELPEIVIPGEVRVPDIPGTLSEEVSGVYRIRTGDNGYRYPAAEYMITPERAGSLVLPSASVRIEGVRRYAQRQSVEVKSLPDSVKAGSAVGDFDFQYRIEHQPETEVVDLVLHISGTGNFRAFSMVDPELSGGAIVDSSENRQIKPTVNGYQGYRERSYRIRPEAGSKRMVIRVSDFVFLNPETGNVERIPGGREEIEVTARQAAQPQSEEEKEIPFQLMGEEEYRSFRYHQHFSQPLSLLWLIPGVAVLLVYVFLRRFKPSIFLFGTLVFLVSAASMEQVPEEQLELFRQGVAAYEEGEYAEAATNFADLLEIKPGNLPVEYNLSLGLEQTGRHGEALFYLRKALRMNPHNERVSGLLNWIEDEQNLDRQVSPVCQFHPDLVYTIFLVLVNILLVVGVWTLIRRTGTMVIVLVFVIILSAVSGIMFTMAAGDCRRPVAVAIDGGTGMKKIPSYEAAPWLNLRGGTAVSVLGSSGDYLLVETGFAMKGWVHSDYVYLIGDVHE